MSFLRQGFFRPGFILEGMSVPLTGGEGQIPGPLLNQDGSPLLNQDDTPLENDAAP